MFLFPVPESPLSQVVFIHDYMQFVFQDEVLSIYNAAKITIDGLVYVMGGAGFADQAVQLIESNVLAVVEARDHALELRFDSGALLHVLAGGANETGPAAYMFSGRNGLVIVEPNS